MVDQLIFQQSAMIIIQEFSSAAKFFYSRCKLFIFFWSGLCLFCYKFFCHNFFFFLGLQTIVYFSSPSTWNYYFSLFGSQKLLHFEEPALSPMVFTTLEHQVGFWNGLQKSLKKTLIKVFFNDCCS
jgi:hypothetical protein